MADSILVKILNSKPITLSKVASAFPKRRKVLLSPASSDDQIGKIVRIENLSLTSASSSTKTTTMKCHRDSLESNNCDEGDDSGTEPWSGSCSSDSLSENSDCHVDQNDSGCDDYMFHDEAESFDLILVGGGDECPSYHYKSCNVDHCHDDDDDDEIAKGNDQNSANDVSFFFFLCSELTQFLHRRGKKV